MIRNIKITDLECAIAIPDKLENPANVILYMIYPKMEGLTADWIESQSNRYDTPIIVIYIPDNQWNNYLTPWPEPGEAKGFPPFSGDALRFLETLENQVIPSCEKIIDHSDIFHRYLVGVSLSGLFTLWQWIKTDLFTSIACLSGSFWYNGFIEWFNIQKLPVGRGKTYFLLGEAEPKAQVMTYRSVGENTEKIVDRLQKNGIPTVFQWVPGNHFFNPLGRAELGIKNLLF